MLTPFFRGNQQAGIHVQKGKTREEGPSKPVEENMEEIFNNLEAEAEEEENQGGPEENIHSTVVGLENAPAEVVMPPVGNIEYAQDNLPSVNAPEKRGADEGRSSEPGNREVVETKVSRKEKGKEKKRSRESSSLRKKFKKLRIPEGYRSTADDDLNNLFQCFYDEVIEQNVTDLPKGDQPYDVLLRDASLKSMCLSIDLLAYAKKAKADFGGSTSATYPTAAQEEIRDLKIMIADRDTSLQVAGDKLFEEGQKLKGLETKIGRMKKESETLREKLEESNESLKTEKENSKALSEIIEKLIQEKKDLEEAKNEEIRILREALEHSKEEKKELQTEVDSFKAEMNSLQDEYRRLIITVGFLKKELEILYLKWRDCKRKSTEWEKESRRLREELDDLENTVAETETLKNQIEESIPEERELYLRGFTDSSSFITVGFLKNRSIIRQKFYEILQKIGKVYGFFPEELGVEINKQDFGFEDKTGKWIPETGNFVYFTI